MRRNLYIYGACIDMILQGYTVKEIAVKLNLSENCVWVYARESGNSDRLKRNIKSLKYYGVRNEREDRN